MSCSTSRIAVPRSRWTSWRVRTSSAVSSRSRPDEGSSSSTRCGSVMSARPTSTRRARPRLRASIGRSATSSSPRSCNVWSMRARSSTVGWARFRQSFQSRPVPRRARSATKQVVAHGHAAEELDALERPSEAEPGSPVDRGAGDVAAVEHDGPAVGPEHAEQAVEEGGLARAVRADEPDRLARLDGDRDVVERGDPGEPLRDVACVEQAHRLTPSGVADAAGSTSAVAAGGGGPSAPGARRVGPAASGWSRAAVASRTRRTPRDASRSRPRPDRRARTGATGGDAESPSGAPGRARTRCPAWIAPSTVRAPSVTTRTSQNSPRNGG